MLKARSMLPLEIARKEVLRKEHRGMAPETTPVEEILEYFVTEYLDGDQTYALGPAVMALSCEAVGGDPAETVPIAAVIILMGSGAEIHDDIIDNSKKKNSRPTVFGKYGSSAAIMVGDTLLVKGFALLNRTFLERHIPSRVASVDDAIRQAIFEHANAECLALKIKECSIPKPETHIQIIRMKGAIIETQARIGGILGGGSNSEIESLAKYGRLLGTLSLMRREFADTFEIQEVRHRIINEYPPLPLLYAFESPFAKRKLMHLIRKDRPTSKDVELLADIVFRTQKVATMIQNMKNMAKEADASIAWLKAGPVESLKLLTWLTISDFENNDVYRSLRSIDRD
jgi:geranylgeranyl pyrophosphate synthase